MILAVHGNSIYFFKIIKTAEGGISGVKGDSLQCREMSAQLTEGTGDRWEMLSPLQGVNEGDSPQCGEMSA